MTLPVPACYVATPSVPCTQPTSLEVFRIAPQPWAVDLYIGIRPPLHRISHPNNWNDIDQWFRVNLTYEADEMFQSYIQGHL
jgi:hypothetical protein